MAQGDVVLSFDSPGTSPKGLAWDGTNLWHVDASSDVVYQIDRTTGSSTVMWGAHRPVSAPEDLAWDGTHLWMVDGTGDRLLKLDPSTGAEVDSFPTPGGAPRGLTWDGANLWVANFVGGPIHKVDPTDGTVLDSVPTPDARPYGLAWDGAALWVVEYTTRTIYRIDPADGSVLASFATPGTSPSGLTWDGTHLWHADGATGASRIYKIEVDSAAPGPITGSITVTLPALSASLTGSVDQPAPTVTGSLAVTLPALYSSLSGTVETPASPVSGTLAATLPALTAALTGTTAPVVDVGTMRRNRATGSRYRTGTGYVDLDVPVEPVPPIVVNPVHTISTSQPTVALSVPAYSVRADGTVESVEATEHTVTDGGRIRVRIGGKDVTFFRGITTEVGDYQLTDPYGWGPGSFRFPQVSFVESESFGNGALSWLRKGANVRVDRVKNGQVTRALYRGTIESIGPDNDGKVTVETSGAVSGWLARKWRPQDLIRRVAEIGWILTMDMSGWGKPFRRTGPWHNGIDEGRVGVKVERYAGGMTKLAWVDQMLAHAISANGDSWTLMPRESDDHIDLRMRDLDTVDFTLYYGAPGVSVALKEDMAESPNRIFGEGVAPNGARWRNAHYKHLGPEVVPPYPFNDGRTFGIGTTDADTDTGDGLFVMQNEMLGSGVGFNLLDRSDVYNETTADAVSEIQRKAGLEDTGRVNTATWKAIFGDDISTWRMTHAEILPLVSDPRTEPFLRAPNGSIIAKSDKFDRNVQATERSIQFGSGVNKSRGRRWALREYKRAQRPAWRGTITLTSDVLEGDHTYGTAGTPMSRLDIRAGMNLRLRRFAGDLTMHVSAVQVSWSESGPTVTLQVDCQGRPYVELAAILERDQATKGNPARRAFEQHRRGSIQSDTLVGWDEEAGAGIVKRVNLTGGRWNKIPVVGGQSGTLNRIELLTANSKAAFAMAIFAREIPTDRLDRIVPNPLVTADEAEEQWTDSRIVDDLMRNRWGLYINGTAELPCGYWPKKHTNRAGTTSHPITGEWKDYAGAHFWSLAPAEPWLYLMVWPDRDCWIEGQLYIQLDEGA